MNLSRDQVLQLQEAFFRIYRCRDGKWFYLVCMGHRGHIQRCLEAMGLAEEVKMIVPNGDLYDSATWDNGTILEHFYLR